MQSKAEQDTNVQAFISPYGGFFRAESKRTELRVLKPESPEVKDHWDHIHIAVFKRK